MNWQVFDKSDLKASDKDVFDIQVAKNISFDKDIFPYKFQFDLIEPLESENSIFEIYPKHTILGPRDV